MSKNINVNPGQYKVAGRERPGEDVVTSDHKARLAQARPTPKPAAAATRGGPAAGATSRTAKKSTR